jgi:hypothetical protein
MSRSIVPLLAAFLLLEAALPAQALSGAYTVGPGGSYPNIGAAGTALITNGVSGPVVFTVTANDVGPWTLTAFAGQGPSNPVVFDGGGSITVSAAGTNIITLNGCANVTFKGFVASVPTTSPTTLETVLVTGASTDCVFDGCTILTSATASGSYTPFRMSGGTNTTIRNCHFGGGYEAFNIGTTVGGTTIERCRILGGGFWIARMGGPNSTLRNCFIYGGSNYGVSCGLSGSTLAAANLKVHNNSFYIVHTAASAQYCSLRWYSDASLNTEVYNNAIHEFHPAVGSGYVMWCSGVLRPTVMNNNVFNLVNGISLVSSSGNQTLPTWQALGFDLASVQADPLFLNVGSSPPDLHLTSGSPCVGAGATLPSVVDDIDGSPRSAPYDVGAHEFSSFNILTFTTSGGGTGDLYYALDLPAAAATEGFLLVTADATQPLGSGPAFGIRPDAMTWDLLVNPSPLFPGNPLHFAMGAPGYFPTVPFVVSPGILSFLGGQTWDAVVITLGPGFVFTGASNVARAAF